METDVYEDHWILMKVSTAIVALAIVAAFLLLVAGWLVLSMMSILFLWIGIETILWGNAALGAAEIFLGASGVVAALIIAIFYKDLQ
jgi:maltodextrin utilization protein YvdJ